MAEYIFDAQSNYGWGLSLNMTGKAPAVAKRIFATYADALDYVNNFDDSAIPGLQLSVINDTDDTKNGIYFVSKIGTKAADGSRANDGVLVKDSGSGAISVSTYAEALTKIKVDATTQEVKNLGQIIYVKTATGTAGEEDYKAAGAYVVTGAATIEKLGTTSASGDIAGDIEVLKGKVGDLEKDLSDHIEEYNEHIAECVVVAQRSVDNEFAIGRLDDEMDAVENTLKSVVKSVNGNTPDSNGAVTLTYETTLAAGVTNAPTTGAVHTAIEGIKTNYAISASTEKTTEGYAKSYTISQGTNEIVTIDIPKDLVVQSGEVIVATEEDKAIDDKIVVGEDYIKLTIKDGSTPIYIAAKSLAATYTSGTADYITVNGYTISLIIANVISHTDEELGKLVVAEGGKTLSTLVKDNKDTLDTLTASGFANGTISNTIFKVTDTLLEGGGPDGEYGSLYSVKQKAFSALQEVKSGNENQLTVAEDENDSTIITLTPVVAVLADLENGTNPEKLLTAGVAKEYIDSLWEWEMLD